MLVNNLLITCRKEGVVPPPCASLSTFFTHLSTAKGVLIHSLFTDLGVRINEFSKGLTNAITILMLYVVAFETSFR
jgi:hypothetical protein